MKLFTKLFSKKTSQQKLPLQLSKLLGYSHGNLGWYEKAFIHKSFLSKADREIPGKSNERLEYLGDAILDTVVADFLFTQFPDENEGFLTKLRSKLVSRKHLSTVAINLGLSEMVKTNLGKHDQSETIYGNALEALIGAIYLDKDYAGAVVFIQKNILQKEIVESLILTDIDNKSKLIEYCQQNKLQFQFINSWIEEKNEFMSELFIANDFISNGIARSKKLAEQEAARLALNSTKVAIAN